MKRRILIIRSRGVALIQVLLISTVISLLAIQFSYIARQQVDVAISLSDRTKAKLQAYSLQNKAIFATIVSEVEYQENVSRDIEYISEHINSSGSNLTISKNSELYVKDISGMIPVRYPEHPLWQPFLLALGYDENQANEIQQYLKDIQDTDVNSQFSVEPKSNKTGLKYINRPLQTKTEIYQYLSIYPTLQKEIDQNIHHHGVYRVNILHSNEIILQALFGQEIGSVLDTERTLLGTGNVTQLYKSSLAQRYPSEAVTTYPSTYTRIYTKVEINSVLWEEFIDVKINTTARPPYTIIGRDN